MKRFIALSLFALFALSLTVFAGGKDFKIVRGRQYVNIVTDSGGANDSTNDSGSVNLSLGIGDAQTEGFTSILGKVYFRGPQGGYDEDGGYAGDYAGIGNQDWGYLMLRTVFNNEIHTLDSLQCEDLPCSLRFVHEDSAGTDTLLKPIIRVDWVFFDTLADTTLTFRYLIDYDIYLQ